jgi:hypothetical protein
MTYDHGMAHGTAAIMHDVETISIVWRMLQ